MHHPGFPDFVITIVKHSQKYFMQQQEYLGHVNGHIEEMYGGHIVMKAFSGEERSVEAFGAYNDKLYTSAWKSQFLSGLMMPVMNFVSNLGYVVICLLGSIMATGGAMTLGDIQAFTQYVRQFTQPITQVANISNMLQQTAAAAERVFEFLAEEEGAGRSGDRLCQQDGCAGYGRLLPCAGKRAVCTCPLWLQP